MNVINLSPIAFSLGPIQIHWYGLMYIAGLSLGFRLAWPRLRALDLSPEDCFSLVNVTILGILIGGRLGYVLMYDLSYYIEHPLHSLYIWRGGMSFHGGALGAAAAFFWVSRRTPCSCWALWDLGALYAPIGLGLGRIGNFINGELFGRITTVPWAMAFASGGPVGRHPSQLYEALLEGLVLFIVLQLMARSLRPRPQGILASLFILGYGCMRFGVEFFREPDPQLGLLWFGLSMGQYLSVLMIVSGIVLVISRYYFTRRDECL